MDSIIRGTHERMLYTQVNNSYAGVAKMVVEQHDIAVEQEAELMRGKATLKAISLREASRFAFCLNPGLEVTEVAGMGKPLAFERDHQILLIRFDGEIAVGDTVNLTISY
ncbi:MAG: hypothetical protein LUD15_09855 [Bacteroides sp.]|nr:hypothetical protein [Bacteroides sp.]